MSESDCTPSGSCVAEQGTNAVEGGQACTACVGDVATGRDGVDSRLKAARLWQQAARRQPHRQALPQQKQAENKQGTHSRLTAWG